MRLGLCLQNSGPAFGDTDDAALGGIEEAGFLHVGPCPTAVAADHVLVPLGRSCFRSSLERPNSFAIASTASAIGCSARLRHTGEAGASRSGSRNRHGSLIRSRRRASFEVALCLSDESVTCHRVRARLTFFDFERIGLAVEKSMCVNGFSAARAKLARDVDREQDRHLDLSIHCYSSHHFAARSARASIILRIAFRSCSGSCSRR